MERRRAQWQRRSNMMDPAVNREKAVTLPVSVLAFQDAQVAVECRRQELEQRLLERRARILRFVTLQPDAPQLCDQLKGTSVLSILESRGEVGQAGNVSSRNITVVDMLWFWGCSLGRSMRLV
jgi:hypothetical protein